MRHHDAASAGDPYAEALRHGLDESVDARGLREVEALRRDSQGRRGAMALRYQTGEEIQEPIVSRTAATLA